MRIEMDTFHPANSKVHMSHSEIISLALSMRSEDSDVVLGYDNMNYEEPIATYSSDSRKVRLA